MSWNCTNVWWHDVHGRIVNGAQKSLDCRTPPKQLPSGPSTLTEDYVRDPFPLGESNKSFRGPVGFDPYYGPTESLGEPHVFAQRFGVIGPNFPWTLLRRLDIDGVPFGTQLPGDPRTGSNHVRSTNVGAHADHHALGNQHGP
jgi:hypothetical protein